MDCPEFDISQINHEKLGVSKERWARYIEMMVDVGYIKGIRVFVDATGGFGDLSHCSAYKSWDSRCGGRCGRKICFRVVPATGNPVLFGAGTDEAMVVCVFKPVLQGVVIDIGNTALSADSRYAHCLEFQIRHGTCCILCQSLVDADTDLLTLDGLTVNEVCTQDLFC